MPVLQHSPEYNQFNSLLNFQEAANIYEDLRHKDYRQLDNLFRTDIDAQYNIVRNEVEDKKYPTGYAVIRDATAAKEIIKPSEDPTQFRIEANNTLLRALGRLRGIDYALEKMQEETGVNTQEIREGLRRQFAEFSAQILDQAKKSKQDFEKQPTKLIVEEFNEKLKKAETQFNNQALCEALHQTNLDQGCKPEDYKKLLFHYRNLAALVDPAKSLVTIAYDAANGVIHRTTQDPITEKSQEQKDAIREEMTPITCFPKGTEKNFQSIQNLAMQTANHYFAGLAAQDDRMLGAQTRKTHLHGLKNAFFVTQELLFEAKELNEDLIVNTPAEPFDTQSFIRNATPVYIGPGEKEETGKARIERAAQQNIEQMRQHIIKRKGLSPEHAEQVNIHITCLVTDTRLEKQGFMLQNYRAICANPENKASMSHIPCNVHGTLQNIIPSPILNLDDEEAASITKRTNGNQAERYRNGAALSEKVNDLQYTSQTYQAKMCASGQDRTGTIVQRVQINWSEDRYLQHGLKTALNADKHKGNAVEQTIAKSRNAAEINSHMVGGSRGCKTDSRGKDFLGQDELFSEATNDATYLKSAKTNKSNPVNLKEIEIMLKQPIPPIVKTMYENAWKGLRNICSNSGNKELAEQGKAILSKATEAWNKTKPSLRGAFINALNQASLVIQDPSNAKQAQRLLALGEGLKHKSKHTLRHFTNALRVLGSVILAAMIIPIPVAAKIFKAAYKSHYQIKAEGHFFDSIKHLPKTSPAPQLKQTKHSKVEKSENQSLLFEHRNPEAKLKAAPVVPENPHKRGSKTRQ